MILDTVETGLRTLVIVILLLLPVVLSEAETLRIPLASASSEKSVTRGNTQLRTAGYDSPSRRLPIV